MKRVIGIGKQDFASLRESHAFYVDKTDFIRDWWEAQDDITLITRPRRFGKTLNMSMLNCFFSLQYHGRSDLFEGLQIWKNEAYRDLQGTYPVIFLSFADVKQTNVKDAIQKIKKIIATASQQFEEIFRKGNFSETQRRGFAAIRPEMDDVTAQSALQDLSGYLYQYYGKKVLLFLDEYDTPMQEAYVHGYWEELSAFIRSLLNSSFKTNLYLERAMMTGITRISKESIFSDLNNLAVITTTSERYEHFFGFTEQEVFNALDEFGMGEKKEAVKKWYDGFTFGTQKDIYNPWSITNFLKEKQFRPYWADTSSNRLINHLIQTAPAEMKSSMEELLQGGVIQVNFDEQIVFEQLKYDENAIWSLMVASGYLKVEKVEYRGMLLEPWYYLKITNLETNSMFSNMFRGWFRKTLSSYNGFVRALLDGNVKEMNLYLNDVALVTFSSFDTGMHPSEKTQPERFYHGFVLGLLVELRDRYEVRSNRESGYGRYDVMLIPHDKQDMAMILEFKVFDSEAEASLQDTVKAALKQIREKCYDAELIASGMEEGQIRHYGFAFEGKKVQIGEED